MKIEKNLMISLEYILRERNFEGKIIERVECSKPLQFIFGTGRMLPSFESNLHSMNKDDKFEFTISSDQAYGDKREEMIIDVPISVFETDGRLDENICSVGNEVPMIDSSGNPLYGTINEIYNDHVKMDFNHPMAGVSLFFSGKVIDVREPSEVELLANTSSCSGCESRDHSSCSGSC
jgi:FKBP-type peptidyl-prolyl cis-trans isomerase SlyD